MTSFEPHDYEARFRLTSEEFENISGMAFSVSIALDNKGKTHKGMIIIPQGGNDPGQFEKYVAWLWFDKKTEVPPNTPLQVKILSPCDPMLMSEEENELKKYRGMKLAGEITHNNNADMNDR